jgi:hypothetical protein
MSSDIQLRRREYQKPTTNKVNANTKAKNKVTYQNREEKTVVEVQISKLINSYSKFIKNNEQAATNITSGYDKITDFNILNMDLLALVLYFIENNISNEGIKINALDDLNKNNFSDSIIFDKYYSLIGIQILDSETIEKKIKYKSDFLRYLYLIFQFNGSK